MWSLLSARRSCWSNSWVASDLRHCIIVMIWIYHIHLIWHTPFQLQWNNFEWLEWFHTSIFKFGSMNIEIFWSTNLWPQQYLKNHWSKHSIKKVKSPLKMKHVQSVFFKAALKLNEANVVKTKLSPFFNSLAPGRCGNNFNNVIF